MVSPVSCHGYMDVLLCDVLWSSAVEEEEVEPMEEEVAPVKSKWELVDYGNGSSDEEDKQQQQQQQQEVEEEEGMKAKDNEKDKMDVVETKTTSV